eukprot:g8573.t1
MKLGTRGKYAVAAMVHLASHGRGVSMTLKELSVNQGLSLAYLEQLMLLLRRAGLVRSVRGKNGGCSLARPARDISVFDIVEAVGEELKATRCQKEEGKGCLPSQGRCLSHNLWAGLELHIRSYLISISLEDICTGKMSVCIGFGDQKILSASQRETFA